MASLNFVQGDYYFVEEDHVFFPEGNSETGNHGSEDVQQLRSAVEAAVFVDQRVEIIGDGFADHFPARNQLGIQAMQDVLEIFPFFGLFRIEQL